MTRKQARTPRGGFLAGLAKLFERGNIGGLLDDDEPDFELEDVEAVTIENWIDELHGVRDAHSHQIQKRAKKLRCTFDAVNLSPSGYISANCRALGDVYEVFLSIDFSEIANYGGGCSCERSQEQQPCEHTYRFASYLLAELSDRSSSLRATISGEGAKAPQPRAPQPRAPQPRAPQPRAPQPSPSRVKAPQVKAPQAKALTYTPMILEQLDHFLATRPGLPHEDTDGDETPAARLTWKLEAAHQGLTLIPLKQRPKKRGGGWTKGQRVALDTLRHAPELITSPADAKVVEALRQQTSGYGYSYYSQPKLVFDMIEAVDALVGHDAVLLEDDAVEVRRFAFGIRVIEDFSELLLKIALPMVPGESMNLTIYANGIIVRSDTRPLVWVCRCDKGQSELAKILVQDVRCPRERLTDLRQRLAEISQTTPVEMPESLAGPIVAERTTPVVLLRSRQQGHLECGMRVKDAKGRVFLPGEGALLYPDTRDDKPVQCQRDPHAEVTKARAIERELNLDRAHSLSPWNWRLLDFEQSLRLLEDLETKANELGFEAAWHPQSAESIRIVGSVTAKNVRVEVSKKRDWFGLNGGCRIGEHEFQLADLLNGIHSEPAAGYMEIQPGHWARITAELREKLQQLRDVAHKNRKQFEISSTAAPIVQDLLETHIDFEAPKAWRDCLSRLDRAQKLDPTPPEDFQGTLRDYQLDGYRWLRRLAEWGVGGCLADDMGLGKTIQALAVLIDRRQTGPALVIAPTSVGFNWVREAERFAPDMKAHLYRETDRAEFLDGVGASDIVVCSYGLALRDADALGKVNWGTLILDEAQFVKNSRTKTSQAIRTFKADWTVALTGTPMENHLGELWSIFRNVSPGLFGSWEDFRDRFAAPIEKDNDDERRVALSRVIRPFVLRRTKSEVLKELPERTEMNLYVELSDQERRRYDEMRLAAVGEIDQIVGLPDTQDQRFRILAMLTRLRQLACHVGLVDAAWEGTSAKLDLLVETMQELRGEGHRALIFSQFTSYLALIRQALDAAGITYEYLDGSTPAKTRQERVDAFQNGNSDAFLISLKAGGTGLNLTAADYVIHMDPWWNPAVEDQATDRAHRIGQERPVMVYRIIARGTIEEQILDMHHGKRDLVAGVMEGTQSAGRLGTDELVTLIRGAAGS
ncbi:MAG: SNF2-related protein [Planctomycetota bacterium]|nr:SNF2-related protein [Planctomycetota bacterium]